jgi:hypothetical protein
MGAMINTSLGGKTGKYHGLGETRRQAKRVFVMLHV